MATEPPPLSPSPPAAPSPGPAIAALAAHDCPACGAGGRWDAAKSAVVCPYCGTVAPATIAAGGAIVSEHDVVRVLRAIPDEQRGWATERMAVRCQDCGAISLFELARVAQRCEFCGAAAIVPCAAAARPIQPDAVLPFSIAETDAREAARRRLGRGTSVTAATGVYVPYWRLTCDLYVHWHASADFGTKEHPQYEPVDGGFSEIDAGQLVPATRGVPTEALAATAPFPLEQLRPYDPAFVSGWIVEQYQLDLVAASDRVCAALSAAAPSTYRRRCGHEVPQRRYGGLVVTATAAVTAFHHLLLPVWVVQGVKNGRTRQVVVNGATGATAGDGDATSSAWGLAAGAALLLLAAWLAWSRL